MVDLTGKDQILLERIQAAIRRPGPGSGKRLRLSRGNLVGVPVHIKVVDGEWARITLLDGSDAGVAALRRSAEAELMAMGWRRDSGTGPLTVDVYHQDQLAGATLVLESLRVLDRVAGSLGEPTTQRLARAVSDSLTAALTGEGPESLDVPGGGYIQWIPIPGGGLHVEAGDGHDADQPLQPDLRERLVACGWGTPDDEVRNCWFQIEDASDVDDAVALIMCALAQGFQVDFDDMAV